MASCGAGCKADQKEDDGEKVLRLDFETTSIFVTDLAKSVKFYSDNFGMCVRVKKTDEMANPEDPTKKIKIDMVLLDTPKNQKKPSGRIEGHLLLMCPQGSDKDAKYKLNECATEDRQFGGICFQCDDMKTSCEKLEKAGVQFFKGKKFGEKSGVMGGKGAKAMDPDGLAIILSARPKAGVVKREWNLGQTIIRCSNMEKTVKFMNDLGLACVISNGDGAKMGFKFRWLVGEKYVPSWKKLAGETPVDAGKFWGKKDELYGKIEGGYHTNVELICNKDQKIDARKNDPMLGFLTNDLKMAKAHVEKLGYKPVWADKDSFAIKDLDGGYVSITEFNPPKM